MTSSNKKTLRITGMDCAACAQTVETGVSKLENVDRCSISFATETLRVEGNIDTETIVARVRELGYDVAQEDADSSPGKGETAPRTGNFFQYVWERKNTRLALLGAILVLPGLILQELLPVLGVRHFLIDLSSIAAMLTAGYPVALSAWRSLKINRQININVLMTIAAAGAVFIGAYAEAAVVMVLFATGEALEGYTAAKARDSIRSLMAVAPNEATVLRPCMDCAGHLGQDGYTGGPCPFCGEEAHTVPIEDLLIGDKIIVKPGQRIPMDGQIQAGASSVNQAPITGESRLVSVGEGDNVFAGSINGEGALEITVTSLAADNTISRLIKLVEEAQEKKAPAQRFIDRFARYYTPAVVAVAVCVAIIPPLFFAQPFLDPGPETQGWLYRALALLVVACPCALVISTPVSIISAISNGAKNGVLFKGGDSLETLGRVKAIAFDKTGTLTRGQPSVVNVYAVDCTKFGGDCANCDDLLALAGAVEQRSEHPLAQAIISKAAQRGLQNRYPAAGAVTAMAGRGVSGNVAGRQIIIGSHTYFDAYIPHPAHCANVAAADTKGYTTMLVSSDTNYKGYIVVADAIRESSRYALAELKRLGINRLLMLTGDNEATAQQVAAQVGVTGVRANCLPADKAEAVAALKQKYGEIAMVGDGINDAPALATASVGIAIGNTAQALETADITLMSDSLRQLPFALRLSRAAMQIIRANIALSLGLKLLVMILVLSGTGSMWMAVLADEGTSLLVTLNGMRLLKRPKMKAL